MDLDTETLAALAAVITAAAAAVTKVIFSVGEMRKQLTGGVGEPTMRKMLEDVHATSSENASRLDRVEAKVDDHGQRLERVEITVGTLAPPH